MKTDFKEGIVRTKDDVIYLCDAEGNYIDSLFNWKKQKPTDKYIIFMPADFYVPTLIDRKTRYLVHNHDLILTRV